MRKNIQLLGYIYIWLFLVLNVVIILNLVIALLARTYGQLNDFRRGLYYDTLVSVVPKYAHDKNYGAMVCSVGISNCVMLALIPVYAVLSLCEKLLKKFNLMMEVILYFPIGLFAVLLFLVVDMLMIPVAWVSMMSLRLQLSRSNSLSQGSKTSKVMKSFAGVLFFGPFILFLRACEDTAAFTWHLFNKPPKDTDRFNVINWEQLEILEEMIKHFNGQKATKPILLSEVMKYLK